MARIDPNEEARRLAASLPRDVWIVAGTSTSEPYPCRCIASRASWSTECSPAWCPCAGRSDPQNADCCGWRFTPQDHLEALAEWQAKKDREAWGTE